MECLAIMPLLNTGKVEDSNVKVPLEAWIQSEAAPESVKALAKKVRVSYCCVYLASLTASTRSLWMTGTSCPNASGLPRGLRTRYVCLYSVRARLLTCTSCQLAPVPSPLQFYQPQEKRQRSDADFDREMAERRAAFTLALNRRQMESHRVNVSLREEAATVDAPQVKAETLRVRQLNSQQSVIENARALAAAAEAARVAAEEEAKRAAEEKERKRRERKERHAKDKADKKAKKKKGPLTPEAKEALKEKKLLKLISPIVVKSCQKYSKDMGVELFKKHAKEVRGGSFSACAPFLILYCM